VSRAVTLAGYAAVVAAALVLELVARAQGHATFGDAVTAAVRWRPLRLIVLAAWLWLGWHLFVRVDRR
jgi:hypothetical protein